MISFKQYINRTTWINELAHLSDYLNKKGNTFLDELLSRKVVCNLKIDQAAFAVGNIDGEVKYFGREGRVEITPFRRQGADLYEEIIKHLQTRNLKRIPSGIVAFLEFFDERLPTLIQYTQKPKNGLIVSYLKKDGKILPPDHPLNEKIADLLAVSPPPVLFAGKLDSKQKDKLTDYANTPAEELSRKYSGKNFVQFVLSLFVPPTKMKYLMTDNLEGLVFYFDNGKKIDMAKITDPSFTEGIKEKGNKDDRFHSELMAAIYKKLSEHANKALVKNPSSFADFIYDMTQAYLKDTDVKKLAKYESQVTANRFARLTFDLLPSKVKSMVDKNWYAEDVYRVLHFMLEKPKKRINARTGLTKERKEAINSIVDQIKGLRK